MTRPWSTRLIARRATIRKSMHLQSWNQHHIQTIHIDTGKSIYLATVCGRLFIYVLPLETPLSRGNGWNHNNRFNNATFLCLSQYKTWISNVISCGFVCIQWVQLRWEVIVRLVDIDGIDNHHCLSFLFKKKFWT